MPERRNIRKDASSEDWLVGGGEMAKLIRSMDWSKTPLGPIGLWPQSLRTTVSLCLASNFPISLAWGPSHVQIYNDGYWPICGGKHPDSMGQDFSVCWASAWPAIGEAFERAVAGETSFLEDQRMFLDRHGYLEETFFTFSFSPIRDETGGVGGLFHPVTETTAKMVGQRRIRVLRDLAARAGKAQNSEDAFKIAAETMSEYDLDLPFAMFYLLNSAGSEARLVARTVSCSEAIAIPTVDLGSPQGSTWPLVEVVRSNQSQQVDDLEARFGRLLGGPYPETLKTAMVLPITPPGCERPLAIFVGGVSSRLPLDESYRAFYDLIATTVTSSVANARAYEEERKRAEALAEIDLAKTAFFSNVSHEFRTPLTLMLGPLEDELAERSSPLPPARHKRLETAHRNSLRLLKLVNTLLDFSRIEAGRMQASYEPTDLAAYTVELASTFRSAIEREGLTLGVECPPLPEPVYVDREMWEKIVLNLLSNAFKHTFEGGIRVALRWCDDCAELAVTDSGVGIPKAELPLLFDRFHRVKGAKSRTHEGTGIGLALVDELIRAHGGTVRVESREGQGTTFTVSVKAGRAHLPPDRLGAQRSPHSTATHATAFVEEAQHWGSELSSAPEPLPLCVQSGSSNSAAVAEGTSGNRPRILWADDNADMRDYVRRLLSERYDVTAVPDGATALAAALATNPDLVLSDVMMPGLDGFGLLRELRADERTRTTPVILLSARASEESSLEGLEAGADDYLVKPFSARELLARVRTHLAMAKLRREWSAELELRVQERTAELLQTTEDLETEIGDRKASQENLRRSQQQLAGIIGSAMDAIITIDDQQRISLFNAAAERMFLFPAEDAIGQPLDRFIPERFRAKHQGHVQDFGKTHVTRRSMGTLGALYGLRADGEEFPIEASISQIESDGKKLYTVILRDITERKRADEALKEQARILDLAPVLIRDLDGRIIFWNAGAEEMYGWKTEEALDQVSHNLLQTEFPRPIAEIKTRFYAHNHWEGELVHTRKDGERIVVVSHWVLHRDEHDKPKAVLEINNDITERKEAEKEIRRLNEELEQRVADRTAQLQAVNKELEAFSYSVSHDLRAPLRHIDGFSQALLEDYTDQLDDAGKSYLREVRSASQEMAQLIDDVLQLARVTRSEMRREVVDLSELVREITAELKKREPKRKVVLNLTEELATRGDKRLLRIVLNNLLGNAWKFTAKRTEGQITFGREQKNGETTYFIRDNGAGFDMAYVGKLFGAFQRLHTAGEFEGTGIGLATVQRIVYRHGGRVWAEGTVNKGATFYFTLPNSQEIGDGQQSDPAG